MVSGLWARWSAQKPLSSDSELKITITDPSNLLHHSSPNSGAEYPILQVRSGLVFGEDVTAETNRTCGTNIGVTSIRGVQHVKALIFKVMKDMLTDNKGWKNQIGYHIFREGTDE
jgi:hypothetical protein